MKNTVKTTIYYPKSVVKKVLSGMIKTSEVRKGAQHELEHTKDRVAALAISLSHLDEIPDYYTRLERMERAAKRKKGR